MRSRLRTDFWNLVKIHRGIIKVIKIQKLKMDRNLEKYWDEVQEEMNIPVNRTLRWYGVVKQCLSQIESGKVTDFTLIETFEDFVKILVEYEADYVISNSEVEALEWGFDMLTDIVTRLEQKYIELRKFQMREDLKLRLHAIEMYQIISNSPLELGGKCVYCGVNLDLEKGDGIHECLGCAQIPQELKPEIEGFEPVKEIEEEENNEEEKSDEETKEPKEKNLNDSEESEENNESEETEDGKSLAPEADENGIIETFIEPEKKEEEKEEEKVKPSEELKGKKVKREFNELMNKMNEKYGSETDKETE